MDSRTERISLPRVMLAAPASRSGKTVITCALLTALKMRGASPVSCKCGPDYIDPMFHREILAVDSRNLDSWFSGEGEIRQILAGAGGECAVLEGVMGIYDGADPRGITGSCYEIARMTDTPIILIIDAGGMGRTVLSVIRGILADDTEHLIRGLILNRIGTAYFRLLRPVIEEELEHAGSGVTVLGGVPAAEELSLGSRHLGLLLPHEISGLREQMSRAAGLLESHVDLDSLERIMRAAPELAVPSAPGIGTVSAGNPVTLAVARDRAFCFYYEENLELFEKRGVRIRFFSPLTDRQVPEDAAGILLGGGYPELYLRELSANTAMLDSLRKCLKNGIPSLAECGGFMYLHERIVSEENESFPMVGAVRGECRFTGHLVRFGYLELVSTTEGDTLHRAFCGMKGHEFHYYDSSCNGDSFVAGKPFRDLKWTCIVTGENAIWGFPHLYYGSRPEAVDAFIEAMRAYHD